MESSNSESKLTAAAIRALGSAPDQVGLGGIAGYLQWDINHAPPAYDFRAGGPMVLTSRLNLSNMTPESLEDQRHA